MESGVSVNAVDSCAAESEFGVLKTSCVYTGRFDSSENKTVLPEEYSRVACPVKAGALVVSRMNTPDLVGAAGYVSKDEPNLFLPDRLWQVFVDRTLADPKFVYWWTQSSLYRDQVRVACAGTSSSMQNLDQDSFRSFGIPRLPLWQQGRIANFLDEQTGRIDALIAEKEKLVERLHEYAHAQGDALFRARLSERGAVRLKYRCPDVTVGIVVTPAKYYVDAGVPCLRSLNVGTGVLNSDNLVYISAEANELHAKSKIFKGDVVVVRSGKTGAAAVVTEEFNGANCIDLVIIRSSEGLDPHWLRAYLNSAPALEQVTDASEGAIQQHFNVGSARELRIPDCAREEQADDLEAISKIELATSALQGHVREHIDRLREYRSSLITAAVTGRINVESYK